LTLNSASCKNTLGSVGGLNYTFIHHTYDMNTDEHLFVQFNYVSSSK